MKKITNTREMYNETIYEMKIICRKTGRCHAERNTRFHVINPLALELDIEIVAHHLCKM